MTVRIAVLALATFGAQVFAADPSVTIDTPMAPPAWALLERQLLSADSKAADKFAA